MTPEAFIEEYQPLAQELSDATGIDHRVFLSQFAVDTAWGTSRLAREANNLTKLKTNDRFDGTYAAFSSLQEFSAAYRQELANPIHAGIVQSVGEPVEAQLQALAESPLDDNHYDAEGGPGTALFGAANAMGFDITQSPQQNTGDTQFQWYNIQKGDTLESIAATAKVDPQEVYDLNKDRIDDPNHLTVGTLVRVPVTQEQSTAEENTQ